MTALKHMAMWTWPDSIRNEDPERMAERLKEARVDTIVPYTCPQRDGAGDPATYFDRLHGITDQAHRLGLEVHACFDEVNAYGEMPVYDLQQVRQDGSKAGVLCPANPAVVDYVLGKLRWTLAEFDYDGINLEDSYIFNRNTIYDAAHNPGERFQSVPVCYCDWCREHAPIEKPEWALWKQERLTDLIAAQASLIRKMKPGMPFSVAARLPYDLQFYAPYESDIPYYEGWEHCQSRAALGADWVAWLERGHIDFACPMSYYHSNRIVELQTEECRQLIPQANSQVWMGLGLGDCTAEYRQGASDDHAADGAKDPALRNDANALDALLQDQVRMGQQNVIFFCYQYLLDEHLPVMARFAGAGDS